MTLPTKLLILSAWGVWYVCVRTFIYQHLFTGEKDRFDSITAWIIAVPASLITTIMACGLFYFLVYA